MRRVRLKRVMGRSGRPSPKDADQGDSLCPYPVVLTLRRTGRKIFRGSRRQTLRKNLFASDLKRCRRYHRMRIRSLLSGREREVLNWLNLGKTSWDISVILSITERTVNYHVGQIIRKLGVSSRVHAVYEAACGMIGEAD
jgi:DNA-binding CsgD family transcriptional regulator